MLFQWALGLYQHFHHIALKLSFKCTLESEFGEPDARMRQIPWSSHLHSSDSVRLSDQPLNKGVTNAVI